VKLNIRSAKRRTTCEAVIQQRIARTIRMLGLLKAGPIYNTQNLADEFSVSRRTVYRDLRALREAGISVQIDKCSEAYYVRAQREPGQIPLRYEQVVLLALAAHLSPLNCSRQLATEIRSAITVLIDGLPHSTQLEVGRLLSHTQVDTDPLPTRVLDEIVRALRHRKPVQVLMETDRGVYANVEIVPSRLVASADGWQLLGYTAGDQNLQSFNVSSFLRVELNEQSGALPAVDRRAISKSRLPRHKSFQEILKIDRKAKAKTFAYAG
jgi:predicted DNA-binding transcriptional regulator YafY